MNADAKFATGMVLTFVAVAALLILDRRCVKKHEIPADGTLRYELLYRNGRMELLLATAAFIVFVLFSPHRNTPYNNYAYLADAWLHGRLDVPELPAYLESVQFGGKTYVHFAPGAALLILPFVALYGVNGFNSGFLCQLLGAVNVALCWRVLTRMKIGNRHSRLWMTTLLGFGTVHFWCASWGSSWLLGHISTLFFLLLALCFLFRCENRLSDVFLAGLFFGLAVCCRLSALLGGLFFIGCLMLKKERRFRCLLCFMGGAAVFGSLYMLYNFARFGTIMDQGYNLTYLKDYHRSVYDTLQLAPAEHQLTMLKAYVREYGGPLQTKFLAYNLYSLTGMLPMLQPEFPWVIPKQSGVALTLVSPALAVALLPSWKKPVVRLLWGATLVTAVPFLLNYGNGQAQFGMRYAMDFTPYLFLLACMGMEKLSNWKKGLIVWSVLINAWGALFWVCYY